MLRVVSRNQLFCYENTPSRWPTGEQARGGRGDVANALGAGGEVAELAVMRVPTGVERGVARAHEFELAVPPTIECARVTDGNSAMPSTQSYEQESIMAVTPHVAASATSGASRHNERQTGWFELRDTPCRMSRLRGPAEESSRSAAEPLWHPQLTRTSRRARARFHSSEGRPAESIPTRLRNSSCFFRTASAGSLAPRQLERQRRPASCRSTSDWASRRRRGRSQAGRGVRRGRQVLPCRPAPSTLAAYRWSSRIGLVRRGIPTASPGPRQDKGVSEMTEHSGGDRIEATRRRSR